MPASSVPPNGLLPSGRRFPVGVRPESGSLGVLRFGFWSLKLVQAAFVMLMLAFSTPTFADATWGYDSLGRPSQLIDGSTGAVLLEWAYDPADPFGAPISYSYGGEAPRPFTAGHRQSALDRLSAFVPADSSPDMGRLTFPMAWDAKQAMRGLEPSASWPLPPHPWLHSPNEPPLTHDQWMSQCSDFFAIWGGMVCTPLYRLPAFGALCTGYALGLTLACRMDAPPPDQPPPSFTTMWCDNTVSYVHQPPQPAHCGSDPVTVITRFCDQYTGPTPPHHYLPDLPLEYPNQWAGVALCLDPTNPFTRSDRPTPDGVYNWAICGPQTARPGWAFRMMDADPSTFCAGH